MSELSHLQEKPLAAPRAAILLAGIVVLVAAPLRFYLATQAVMVSRDSVVFIWYAQNLARDPLAEICRQRQHPGYPAMLLAAHRIIEELQELFPAAGRAAALSDPVFSWETAGMAVTFAGGLAVILAMYLLAATLFDRRVGLLAAVLTALAAEFAQLSADALTDMPHLALYLLAATCCIRGLQGRKMPWLLLGGILSGLAYLIRPEGAEVAVVTAALLLVWPVAIPGRRYQWRAAGAVVLAFGALLPAAPYMAATGKIVQKKSVLNLLGVPGATHQVPAIQEEPGAALDDPLRSGHPDELPRLRLGLADASPCTGHPPWGPNGGNAAVESSNARSDPPSADPAATGGGGYRTAGADIALAGSANPTQIGRAVLLVLEKWARSLRGTLLVPAIVWLALWRWEPRVRAKQRPGRGWPAVPAANPEGLRLLLALEGLHLLIVIALVLRFEYWELLSVRHTLVLAALTLPLAAAGFLAIIQALPQRGRTFGAVLLMGALIAPTLPWMLERRFADDRYLREAAEWLRTQPGSRRILTTRHRVAFYADGRHVWSPLDANVEAILAAAHDERPDYLVFDQRRLVRQRPTFFSDLQSLIQPGEELELVLDQPQTSPPTADHALVYRYRRLP